MKAPHAALALSSSLSCTCPYGSLEIINQETDTLWLQFSNGRSFRFFLQSLFPKGLVFARLRQVQWMVNFAKLGMRVSIGAKEIMYLRPDQSPRFKPFSLLYQLMRYWISTWTKG